MDKILDIKKYPDKALRKKCRAIERVSEKETELFQNMLLTMRNSSGIGLAAPQVGINCKLIVADVGAGPIQLANPEVIKVKGKDRMEEGCLSVPGALVNITRPAQVLIRGLNEKGQVLEIKVKGLLARVLLHEIDHLNGKLILDYMNLLQRLKFKLNNKKKGN